MQKEQPLPDKEGLGLISWDVISRLKSEQDALLLCLALSQTTWSKTALAKEFDVNVSTMSRIIDGQVALGDRDTYFQTLCGNWAILQYKIYKAGMAKRLDVDFAMAS